MNQTKSHLAIRALVEGALFVALAELLGYLKIWHMPQGGSISLMMVPILLYAFRWGMKFGLLAGLALGIIDFMLGGGIAIGWQSILGDYVIACTAMGLAGVFSGKKWGFFPAMVLGGLGRFAAIYVTGATLWAILAPEEIFGLTVANPWMYSFLYNLPILITVVVSVFVGGILYAIPALRVYLTGKDLGR